MLMVGGWWWPWDGDAGWLTPAPRFLPADNWHAGQHPPLTYPSNWLLPAHFIHTHDPEIYHVILLHAKYENKMGNFHLPCHFHVLLHAKYGDNTGNFLALDTEPVMFLAQSLLHAWNSASCSCIQQHHQEVGNFLVNPRFHPTGISIVNSGINTETSNTWNHAELEAFGLCFLAECTESTHCGYFVVE